MARVGAQCEANNGGGSGIDFRRSGDSSGGRGGQEEGGCCALVRKRQCGKGRKGARGTVTSILKGPGSGERKREGRCWAPRGGEEGAACGEGRRGSGRRPNPVAVEVGVVGRCRRQGSGGREGADRWGPKAQSGAVSMNLNLIHAVQKISN
jgi:hypothetical protein